MYNMAGNVAEWVADVYRPIIDNDANDFSYFRGNVFEKKKIDEFGNVEHREVQIEETHVQHFNFDDGLPGGKI